MSRRRFVAQMKNMISHNDIGDALLQVFICMLRFHIICTDTTQLNVCDEFE